MTEGAKVQTSSVTSAKKKGRGKNFKVDQLPSEIENDDAALDFSTVADLNIPLPKNASSTRNIALYKYKGMGLDPLLSGLYRVFEKAVKSSINSGQKNLAIVTITYLFNSGLASFAKYLTILASVFDRDILWSDINKDTIDQYINYLQQGELSFVSQKSKYSQTKSLLMLCFNHGLLPHVLQARELFPKNPYPNVNQRKKGSRPFSKQEFKRLARVVRKEYVLITQGDQPLSSYELGVCVLALAIRTGINRTPVLELPVDCLQAHPLKPEERMLLVWFKRRSNNTHIQSARKSDDISGLESIQYDVVDLINLVRRRNETIRQLYEDPTRLFVYKSRAKINGDDICVLDGTSLRSAVSALVKKHNLMDDDCKTLRVNLSRLRITFVNRIFDLSGQDPLVTARYGGHSPQTANNHYWTPPPEAEANHRKLIEEHTSNLIATDLLGGERATPIAKCRDTKNGQRAPKNGEHCTEILACFRCKSFVVTKGDLHRLYSFYWSMIEDRETTDTKIWGERFRHIRAVIDENIAPQFDATEVAEIKADAKLNRHPFWKNLTMLRMAR